jgi:hypothetical protein
LCISQPGEKTCFKVLLIRIKITLLQIVSILFLLLFEKVSILLNGNQRNYHKYV